MMHSLFIVRSIYLFVICYTVLLVLLNIVISVMYYYTGYSLLNSTLEYNLYNLSAVVK